MLNGKENSMSFKYVYSRHFVEGEEIYDTLDEALERAEGDHDNGLAYFLRIEDDKEKVIYDHDAILALMDHDKKSNITEYRPVCPFCNTKMEIVMVTTGDEWGDEYDDFYWSCECNYDTLSKAYFDGKGETE